MDFALTRQQEMIVDTTRQFTERELMPHEEKVERAGEVAPDLVQQIKQRSIAAGIYACNMPLRCARVKSELMWEVTKYPRLLRYFML